MMLEIRGQIWSGHKSRYIYKITEAQAKALQAHKITAISLAGDFAKVTAWRLRDTVTAYQREPGLDRQLIETRTVASWRW